jgi:hypothetical protein
MKTEDFVLLRIGAWALALPRREVRDLLTPQGVEFGDARATLRVGDRTLPVLALDDSLLPAHAALPARRICVLLEAANTPFAMLCDAFEHRIDPAHESVTHPLPLAMRSRGSPVSAVLQIGDAVAAVTDADALFAAFAQQLTLEAVPV